MRSSYRASTLWKSPPAAGPDGRAVGHGDADTRPDDGGGAGSSADCSAPTSSCNSPRCSRRRLARTVETVDRTTMTRPSAARTRIAPINCHGRDSTASEMRAGSDLRPDRESRRLRAARADRRFRAAELPRGSRRARARRRALAAAPFPAPGPPPALTAAGPSGGRARGARAAARRSRPPGGADG